jgi:hypothetical protein
MLYSPQAVGVHGGASGVHGGSTVYRREYLVTDSLTLFTVYMQMLQAFTVLGAIYLKYSIVHARTTTASSIGFPSRLLFFFRSSLWMVAQATLRIR